MIPSTVLLRQAARFSRSLSTTVDLYLGSTLIQGGLPVTGGKISGDRTSKVRLTADLTLGLALGEKLNVTNQRSQVRIYRGVPSLGTDERMMLGCFRVDEVDYDVLGGVGLKCSGMESYVLDARFLKPRVPQFAVSATAQIKQLITEAIPSAKIRVRATKDAKLRVRTPWAQERWDAIDSLSAFLGVETYSDYTGGFVIANAPDLNRGVPVFAVTEGATGVLVGRSQNDTRDQVYNAVSVSGTSSDPTIPPFWAWAYDNDSNSPTYYWADPLGPAGGFGQVPRFYTSGFFTNNLQCQQTADRMLGDALAQNRSLDFTSVPLEFLETGDLVAVDLLDGTRINALIQTFEADLGVDGGYSATTMSTKVAARESDSL